MLLSRREVLLICNKCSGEPPPSAEATSFPFLPNSPTDILCDLNEKIDSDTHVRVRTWKERETETEIERERGRDREI